MFLKVFSCWLFMYYIQPCYGLSTEFGYLWLQGHSIYAVNWKYTIVSDCIWFLNCSNDWFKIDLQNKKLPVKCLYVLCFFVESYLTDL